MDNTFTKGIAFILEGDTEKFFYLSLLRYFCSKHEGYIFEQCIDDHINEIYYRLSSEDSCILIKMNVVGTISQITNSAAWFQNRCRREYATLNWTVFLCYDTDDYTSEISKFYKGDWASLRKRLQSGSSTTTIIDLAASADIEDVFLLDINGIFSFLSCDPIPIPSARKGKQRMKKLFRNIRPGLAYHEGSRAEPLIEALDKEIIIKTAPISLKKIEEYCFNIK